MITLNLAIYEGDAVEIQFSTTESLMDYIDELKSFDCVWLIAGETEIFVTENLDIAYEYVRNGFFFLLKESSNLYIQEYQSFEEAYKVALAMYEENPKCYEK